MARVIKIGKRNWLAGLSWNSFEDVPNKAELQDDADRLGAAWSCMRINEAAIQAGFCAPVEGIKHPSKLYSLAAMLADSREQPWLGIFKIEEGLWWYIAVRDGHAILPDGDVIGGEDEILAARERHSGYADWNYIEGDVTLLSDFINEIDAKPTPVRSLYGQNIPTVQLFAAAVILFAIIGGGYYWWLQEKQAVELSREAAAARTRALIANKTTVNVSSPLLALPQPNDWLSACGNILLSMPLSQAGWQLDQVSCDNTAATIHWIRKEGATVAIRPEGVLSPQGDDVDQVIQLSGLNMHGINDAIALPDAQLALRSWSQSARFTLSFADSDRALVMPGANSTENTTFPQTSVQLTVPVSPFNLDMSVIPGLRLNSLKTTTNGWILKGVLYGR